jgi:hypothetical protein
MNALGPPGLLTSASSLILFSEPVRRLCACALSTPGVGRPWAVSQLAAVAVNP